MGRFEEEDISATLGTLLLSETGELKNSICMLDFSQKW
jgi:hypothetical protein